MKREISMMSVTMFALAVAVCGCASQQHSLGDSAPNSPPRTVTAHDVTSGWYLMQPPVRHGNPETGARLADWQVIAFFERSTQCDDSRAHSLTVYPSYLLVSTSGSMNSLERSQRLASATVCVAADDLRINWFHLQW